MHNFVSLRIFIYSHMVFEIFIVTGKKKKKIEYIFCGLYAYPLQIECVLRMTLIYIFDLVNDNFNSYRVMKNLFIYIIS